MVETTTLNSPVLLGMDGLVSTKSPDGTTVTKWPDGTTVTTKPDGTKTTENKDGSWYITFPENGTTITKYLILIFQLTKSLC